MSHIMTLLKTKTSITDLPNKKLRGLSPRANYTDKAAAAGRRSWCQLFLRIKWCHVVSATDPHDRQSLFSGPEPLLFIQVTPQLTSRG